MTNSPQRNWPQLAGVLRHARAGTLMAAIARRLAGLGLRRRAPGRFDVRTPDEAAKVLAELTASACGNALRKAILVGPAGPFANAVAAGLDRLRIPWHLLAPATVRGLSAQELAGVGCITLVTLSSSEQLSIARDLVRNKLAADVPLEYIALPHLENAVLAQYDRYRNEDFVSPHLALSGGAFHDLYRESLTRFAQKTDIRDFLDLAQLLRSVVERRIAGNVAEFGSFRGHSGWLASRVLDLAGSDKTLFMFDMFENFPEENVGVDRFWSGTHRVDFASVQAKFADRPNVRLVKGDFTQTLPQTDTGALALAYIDCDSYRATRFLLEYLWAGRVSPGGIVVMEDYGHAALLGNRLAVHEFFDGRRDAFTFFSGFSGFFVAVKLPPSPGLPLTSPAGSP